MAEVYDVNRLLTDTMRLMGETDKTRAKVYTPYAVSLTNRVLSDLFNVNNSIRGSKGLKPFEEEPVVKNLTDIIPYEYESISNMMVYWMAWAYYFQDDENAKANLMNDIYEANKARFGKALYRQTRSVI